MVVCSIACYFLLFSFINEIVFRICSFFTLIDWSMDLTEDKCFGCQWSAKKTQELPNGEMKDERTNDNNTKKKEEKYHQNHFNWWNTTIVQLDPISNVDFIQMIKPFSKNVLLTIDFEPTDTQFRQTNWQLNNFK